MTIRKYDQGNLVEEWSDEEMVYRRFQDGELVEERPYNEQEASGPQQRLAEAVRQATIQDLRDQLAAGVAGITAARDAAESDAQAAEAFRVQAVAAVQATAGQRTLVSGFTPTATYSAAQLGQVRDAIGDALARIEQTQQALAEFYAYRVQVDQNAILTDNALLWLARLVSGALGEDS